MALDAATARAWLGRWDRQQELYIPDREDRFAALFSALAAQVEEPFHALDLACGPGSLASRLLDRFPRARVTAVDFDPVLLAIGRAARPPRDDRLTWVEADLRRPEWRSELPRDTYDAVLSTTALHWFDAATLGRIYADLGRLVRPGGLFLNGDDLRRAGDGPLLRALLDRVRERARESRAAPGAEDWEAWWAHVAEEPGLAREVDLRQRRFPAGHSDLPPIPLETHEAALRAAGFRETGVLRQRFDNRLLVAIR